MTRHQLKTAKLAISISWLAALLLAADVGFAKGKPGYRGSGHYAKGAGGPAAPTGESTRSTRPAPRVSPPRSSNGSDRRGYYGSPPTAYRIDPQVGRSYVSPYPYTSLVDPYGNAGQGHSGRGYSHGGHYYALPYYAPIYLPGEPSVYGAQRQPEREDPYDDYGAPGYGAPSYGAPNSSPQVVVVVQGSGSAPAVGSVPEPLPHPTTPDAPKPKTPCGSEFANCCPWLRAAMCTRRRRPCAKPTN